MNMIGRRLISGFLRGAGVRALIVAVLALFLVLAYAKSDAPPPPSEEVRKPKPTVRGFASEAAVPGLTLVSSVRAALAQPVAQAQARAQEAVIVQALVELLGDTLPAVREAAASALGERGPAAGPAVPALLTALSDPQRRVRQQAAEALGEIGDPAAVGALTDVLALDASREVAEEAAQALGRIGTAEAASGLEVALVAASVRDEPFRRAIVQALGRTGQPAAVERLEELFPIADRRLQETIVEAFADAETAAATDALLRMIRSSDPNLRLMAARALGGR
jgi:HEAT repeat protein